MGKLNKNSVGLAFGVFLAAWHALWSLMVASGYAQKFLNWVYSIHFLNNPFKVNPFDLNKSLTLIVATAVIGYVLGCFFAMVWNWLHKKK
jgi:hypothetical protein